MYIGPGSFLYILESYYVYRKPRCEKSNGNQMYNNSFDMFAAVFGSSRPSDRLRMIFLNRLPPTGERPLALNLPAEWPLTLNLPAVSSCIRHSIL